MSITSEEAVQRLIETGALENEIVDGSINLDGAQLERGFHLTNVTAGSLYCANSRVNGSVNVSYCSLGVSIDFTNAQIKGALGIFHTATQWLRIDGLQVGYLMLGPLEIQERAYVSADHAPIVHLMLPTTCIIPIQEDLPDHLRRMVQGSRN